MEHVLTTPVGIPVTRPLPQTRATYRINSIDLLRGLIMIIMALDHTRDFFHKYAWTQEPLSMETTTPILFFTRWITHFCAPTFVFLAGTAAFMTGQRKTKAELSRFQCGSMRAPLAICLCPAVRLEAPPSQKWESRCGRSPPGGRLNH